MSDDRARHAANATGLQDLPERHLAELAKSVQSAADLARKLPRDLHWSEEPALILRLFPEPVAKP